MKEFLSLAKLISSKRTESVFAWTRLQAGVLIATNPKEWLFSSTDDTSESGLYDTHESVACGKLTKTTDVPAETRFPESPSGSFDLYATVDERTAKTILEASKYVTNDKTRYFLTGVFIDGHKGKIVATDGRRLYLSAGIFIGDSFSFTVSKALKQILKKGQSIRISPSTTWIRFTFKIGDDYFIYYIQRVEGQYPNYSRVIPDRESTKIITASPDISTWNAMYPKIKAIWSKDSRRILITPNDLISVRVSVEDLVIGNLPWAGLFPNPADKPILAINASFLDDVFKIGKVSQIRLTEYNKAIVFCTMNGAEIVVMPMQAD